MNAVARLRAQLANAHTPFDVQQVEVEALIEILEVLSTILMLAEEDGVRP